MGFSIRFLILPMHIRIRVLQDPCVNLIISLSFECTKTSQLFVTSTSPENLYYHVILGNVRQNKKGQLRLQGNCWIGSNIFIPAVKYNVIHCALLFYFWVSSAEHINRGEWEVLLLEGKHRTT